VDNPVVSLLKGGKKAMNANMVYVTSAGIMTGTKTNAREKYLKIDPKCYEAFLEKFQIRNVDRISKISLAAAAMTLMKRNILDPSFNIERGKDNDYGIVFGTQFSALESIHNYDIEALEKGALAVNPGLFPNTVLNSPACQISIQCSFAGPVYTVCNGLTSSLDAIGMGYNFVKAGLSSMVLAGGVDEITELQTKMQSNDKHLGEASGFIMLESERTITENTKLAKILAYKSIALNKEQRTSMSETVSSLILDAVTSGESSIVDITSISLASAFSYHESNNVLSEICKKMNYHGNKECVKTDWMGACGILQTYKALKATNGKMETFVLLNIENGRAAAVVLRTYKWPSSKNYGGYYHEK